MANPQIRNPKITKVLGPEIANLQSVTFPEGPETKISRIAI
jgi:hypothetical protein